MAYVTRRNRPPVERPKDTQALTRLLSGQATPQDESRIRRLVEACGQWGCTFTKLSRTSQGFDSCPGWCKALEVYEQAQKAREQALRQGALVKPRKLIPKEKRALEALDAGEKMSTSDLLSIELLCVSCKDDGCVNIERDEPPKSGFTSCPGWCAQCRRAWHMWWLA